MVFRVGADSFDKYKILFRKPAFDIRDFRTTSYEENEASFFKNERKKYIHINAGLICSPYRLKRCGHISRSKCRDKCIDHSVFWGTRYCLYIFHKNFFSVTPFTISTHHFLEHTKCVAEGTVTQKCNQV